MTSAQQHRYGGASAIAFSGIGVTPTPTPQTRKDSTDGDVLVSMCVI